MARFTLVLGAALFGAAFLYAQDKSVQGKCAMASLCCPKAGDCDGKCREICDNLGATVKAVRARVVGKMKAEFGVECSCTAGTCAAESCSGCEAIKSRIFAPLVKERVEARVKGSKTFTHSVKSEDGRATKEVECTFLTATPCPTCVEELADAVWKGLKRMMRIDEIGAAVKARLVERIKKEGLSLDCPCSTGKVSVDDCPECRRVKTEVFGPLLKARMEARRANPNREMVHTVNGAPVKCAFPAGELCGPCMDELADAVFAKIKELSSKKQ